MIEMQMVSQYIRKKVSGYNFRVIAKAIVISSIGCGIASCSSTEKIASTSTVYGLSKSELSKFKKSAVNGDSGRSLRVAQHLIFIESDERSAMFWLRLSMEQGSDVAKSMLAGLLAESQNGEPEAIRLYTELLAVYPAASSYMLGEIYKKRGDIVKATEYYREAANNENDIAMMELVKILGRDIEGYCEAARWIDVLITKGGVHKESYYGRQLDQKKKVFLDNGDC